MKKTMLFLCVIALALGMSTSAYALLIDLGNGVTKDDKGTFGLTDDQYWIQDINSFVGLTYDEQITAISNLSIAELPDVSWHMATYSDLKNLVDLYPLGPESPGMTDAFLPTSSENWTGRYDRIMSSTNPNDPNAPYHYQCVMWIAYNTNDTVPIYGYALSSGASDSSVTRGAFVTGYTPAPVPEPATMFLFGSGLIGLFGIRRKSKK